MNETLLRVEFGRDAVNSTDQPIQFVLGEVQAIVDRGVPLDVALLLTAGEKIVVTISME